MVSAVGFTGVGVVTLMERDLDQWGAATLGLDPMIMLGLGTIGFAGVGWLMGPFFGNAVFNAMYRNVRGQIEAVSLFLPDVAPRLCMERCVDISGCAERAGVLCAYQEA
jgi:hypothetical protein